MPHSQKENYKIARLGNGTRVVAAPMKERSSVAMGIWVYIGGRDENPQLNGVSHFLEHLVFKGTGKRTANQIKEAVEGRGGSLNAFTSEEYTCFLAKASSRHFDEVFDVLADMVIDPLLKESDIEKERTVVMEEIKMTQDQPSELAEEHLSELIWGGHALGRPLAGTVDSVSKLTRKDIVGYQQKFYEPSLLTVAAAGDIALPRLLKATEKRFAKMKPREGKSIHLFSHSQSKPGLKFFHKSTEQTHISLGLHALEKSHPQEYALSLLSIILGGNMSSRLFNEVREKRGLAYEIGSFVRKYHETGAFVVSAGVDNKKAAEAIEVILNELQKMAKKQAKPDELKRAKDFYLGQMDLGLESSMSKMLWVGEDAVCLGRCRTREEMGKAVEKVSLEDLRALSKAIFNSKVVNLSVVGPNIKPLEKRFGDFRFFGA